MRSLSIASLLALLSLILIAGVSIAQEETAKEKQTEKQKTEKQQIDDLLGGQKKTETKKAKDDPKSPTVNDLEDIFGTPKTGDDKGGKNGEKAKLDDIFGDPKDKKNEKKTTKKQEPKEKPSRLSYSGKLVGRVVSTGGTSGIIKLEVTTTMQVPNADGQRQLLQRQRRIAQLQFQIQTARNFQDRQRRMLDLAREMNQQPPKLYDLKEYKNEVQIRTGEEIKVRVATPEPQYDEKGNLVKMTREFLQKLRGPENLPGFPADRGDLNDNQVVQIYYRLPKVQKAEKKSGKVKKGTDIADILGQNTSPEDGGDALVNNNLPEAVLVVILQKQ